MPDNNRITPPAIAKLIMNALPRFTYAGVICDVGCGPTGVWGAAAKDIHPYARVIYIDTEDYSKQLLALGRHDPSYNLEHDLFYRGDFLIYDTSLGFARRLVDLWVCNPPYPKAETFFWQMKALSHSASRILMFLSNGWIEGKDRRNRIFDIIPPNLIVFLDGRIMDKTHPEESGTDNHSRAGFYWDLARPVKPGETRCKWVGSDNVEDYRVSSR